MYDLCLLVMSDGCTNTCKGGAVYTTDQVLNVIANGPSGIAGVNFVKETIKSPPSPPDGYMPLLLVNIDENYALDTVGFRAVSKDSKAVAYSLSNDVADKWESCLVTDNNLYKIMNHVRKSTGLSLPKVYYACAFKIQYEGHLAKKMVLDHSEAGKFIVASFVIDKKVLSTIDTMVDDAIDPPAGYLPFVDLDILLTEGKATLVYCCVNKKGNVLLQDTTTEEFAWVNYKVGWTSVYADLLKYKEKEND
jgi:hypothetical protein